MLCKSKNFRSSSVHWPLKLLKIITTGCLGASLSSFLLMLRYRMQQNFRSFSANRESFPSNHLLCTVNNDHGLMHRESFPVNSVFCA